MLEKQLLKGNIAIAAAALNCGCKGYFGYPITPQTDGQRSIKKSHTGKCEKGRIMAS